VADPAAAQPAADDRSTAFRPVEGGGEMQSGEKLLVEAYAAIWLILFVLLVSSRRKQRRLDERVSALESALAAAEAKREKKRSA
jgi:CcmD family protein